MTPAQPNPFLVERVGRELGEALQSLQRRIGAGSHVFILVQHEGVTFNGGTIPPWIANQLLAELLSQVMQSAFASTERRDITEPPR